MKPINEAHVERDLSELAKLGAQPSGGMSRFTLTAEEARAREYIEARLRDLGCEITHDAVGNMIARRPARDMSAPGIWTGSHLDTVPEGGRFDGAGGVVAAVAAVEAMAGIQTRAPVEVVVFIGEEGSRFPKGTLGSAVCSGHIPLEVALRLTDADGVTVRQALADHGVAGERRVPVGKGEVGAYLELHIEQGDILESQKIPIGVVSAIAGMQQMTVRLEGRANHAGATPMDRRADALVAAAELVIGVEAAAVSLGAGAVATAGNLRVVPGAFNIIPGGAAVDLDLRSPQEEGVVALTAVVERMAGEIARRRGVKVAVQRRQKVAACPMDARVMEASEAAAKEAGLASVRLASGAVHDALCMAEVAPAGMIFVPSVGGLSHCPDEKTRTKDLAAGADVLARALVRLAS